MLKKLRTREHIIADLSVNYVERFILEDGHTLERIRQDYGYDLVLRTHNKTGEIEPGIIFVQMKAVEQFRRVDGEIRFTISVRDILLWTEELAPVLLIVYEASTRTAHWCDVQDVFREAGVPMGQATITITVQAENLVQDFVRADFEQLKEKYKERYETRFA